MSILYSPRALIHLKLAPTVLQNELSKVLDINTFSIHQLPSISIKYLVFSSSNILILNEAINNVDLLHSLLNHHPSCINKSLVIS